MLNSFQGCIKFFPPPQVEGKEMGNEKGYEKGNEKGIERGKKKWGNERKRGRKK